MDLDQMCFMLTTKQLLNLVNGGCGTCANVYCWFYVPTFILSPFNIHIFSPPNRPVPIQKLANSLGKMTLDTIPSSSIVDKNNIGVDPETGDYMTLPGGEEGDYLHLDKTR